MYREKEVDISEKWLGTIFSLEYNTCLIGGWAVYETVIKNFQNETGHLYIGSKDIDIGFHINPDWSFKELKNSSYMKFLNFLEQKKFQWIGFRFFKGYDYETGKELTKEQITKKLPFEVINLYIDPIVDNIHPDLQKKFKINPIDEPLLSKVFEFGMSNKITLSTHTKIEVNIPKPEVLLAMKFNSVDNRTKDHKRIKDIADIFALIWYSDPELEEIKEKVGRLKDFKKIKKTITNFKDDEIIEAAKVLDYDQGFMKIIFNRFLT